LDNEFLYKQIFILFFESKIKLFDFLSKKFNNTK